MNLQESLFTESENAVQSVPGEPPLFRELAEFSQFGRDTLQTYTACVHEGVALKIPTFVNEFWTSKQRAAHSLHEVSYRACFKPQLPRFFIERLTNPNEYVYDPFMGRGTTLLEAALLKRIPVGCDINPLSPILLSPRVNPPTQSEISRRLSEIDLSDCAEYPEDLLTFYHPTTLRQICSLRNYLLERVRNGGLDYVDEWVRMVAINRLTGHSPGFFSVYTLPPNQAVSIESQRKINYDRDQTPPERDIKSLILKKSRSLLSDCQPESLENLKRASKNMLLVTSSANETPSIPSNSVSLVVTSPPFLDVVDYAGDNWLRCWFSGIDTKSVKITMSKKLEIWQSVMTSVFRELKRVLSIGGHVAFEVGEIRGGKLRLEEAVVPCGLSAGLDPVLILINDQHFTKTANCWGVKNGKKGTNTNRIILFCNRS